MHANTTSRVLVNSLLQNQRRLYGFILSIVADANEADDIFQETSIKLWELAEQYDPSRPFMPWACGVAFNVIRNHRTRRRRDRHLFSDELLGEIAAVAVAESHWLDERRRALADCMAGLSGEQRRMVEMCYDGRRTIAEAASACGQSREGFYKKLQRLRRTLMDCVNRRVEQEGTP